MTTPIYDNAITGPYTQAGPYVEHDEYLRTPEAADYVGVSEGLLKLARTTGRNGPNFYRQGRFIVYKISELDEWANERYGPMTYEVIEEEQAA